MNPFAEPWFSILGAWVNGACAFGAVARLGSSEWAYAATPLGFCVGCLSVMPLFTRPAATSLADASPPFDPATGVNVSQISLRLMNHGVNGTL